jgi:hypothetical protein
MGFTGTQKGMTPNQLYILDKIIKEKNPYEVHHGDCVGADTEFHQMCKAFGSIIIIHPPDISTKRSNCEGDKILPVKPYLDRNKDIVNSCDLLIVCPKTRFEEIRSGTWSTKRYAQKRGVKFIIIYSDGLIFNGE